MDGVKKVQAVVVTIAATITGWLGYLAIPVYILLACNIFDYITALIAAPKRGQSIDSLKGLKGLAKKVLMYLLIAVGVFIDIMITYAGKMVKLDFQEPFIVGIVVAIWLVFNEMISILENIVDADGPVPPFMIPMVKNLKKKTEEVAEQTEKEEKPDEIQ